MKIVTVVGARPQFVKAAAVSRIVTARSDSVREVLVHTGQHYDAMMSDVFFSELGIPAPKHHLGVGGGSHGQMTGRMIEAVETVLIDEAPDWVLVYGDTNSTLAAAIAASKLHVPIAHVEAGLRSFNMRMPEEINRIVADRIATVLFCPTSSAVDNLRAEGIQRGVLDVGDVMFDAALYFAQHAERRSPVRSMLGITPKEYVLATCHRAENTDDRARLAEIIRGLDIIAERLPVIMPIHPRTRARLASTGLQPNRVRLIDPVSYLDMVVLEREAAAIVTDSGGVQKEAFFYQVPCITIRDETEWVETVRTGWNTLAGANAAAILAAFERRNAIVRTESTPYGDGHAAERIVTALQELRA